MDKGECTKLSMTNDKKKSHKNYKGYNNGVGYAVAQLIEALRYKPEGRELIPDDIIRIFQ
jgi:hypothetical protein